MDGAEEALGAQDAQAADDAQGTRQAEACGAVAGMGGDAGVTDYERAIGERDARIAELEAQGESDRVDFRLRLAGGAQPQGGAGPCWPTTTAT